MTNQAPRENPQLATPRPDRQRSEDLAREAEAYDGSSGMDTGPETPTPMPTNNEPNNQPPPYEQPAQPNMADIMREMQAYMQQQQAHMQQQQAQIQELQTTLQQTTINNNTNNQQQTDPNTNIMAQFMSLLQSHTAQDPLEKEENRITRLATHYWRDHFPRLIGRENFALWQRAVLIDAEYIGAREILVNEIDRPPQDQLERVRWEVQYRLLHTRILDMLHSNIRQQVQSDHIQSPVHLWRKLNTIYGLSRAEERLVSTKTLINLNPQGNPVAMMRQWEELTSAMEEKGYTAAEIFHDIGIILLGDWQKTFVHGELDNLFALSKDEDIHQLDHYPTPYIVRSRGLTLGGETKKEAPK